jgi:predicted RNA binding protein YcfA (HicA-like mRNA interferase family)
MPKLPPVKPRELVRFLEQHGFILDHVTGSHQIFYNPQTKRRAVVAKHNREIPKGTLISLLKEAGFTKEELREFLQER